MKNCIRCHFLIKDSGWTLSKESRDKVKNKDDEWYEKLVQVECRRNLLNPSPKNTLYCIGTPPGFIYKEILRIEDAARIKLLREEKRKKEREEMASQVSGNIYKELVNKNRKKCPFYFEHKEGLRISDVEELREKKLEEKKDRKNVIIIPALIAIGAVLLAFFLLKTFGG